MHNDSEMRDYSSKPKQVKESTIISGSPPHPNYFSHEKKYAKSLKILSN